MSSLLNSVNRIEDLLENQYIGQSPAALLADIIHYTENQDGLDFDSVLNTHPVAMNISDPTEAAAAFDAISYSKSAALFDMLR